MDEASGTQSTSPAPALTSVRTIAGNAVSLLASDTASRAATFVLFALVARHLSTYEFGQVALGLSLVRSFQLLAVAGLQTLITREVAKDPAKTGHFLANGSAVVIITSLLSVAALFLFTRVMAYAPSTTSSILLLSLGLLPYSLSVICDAVFRAREKMQYIAYSNLLANAMRIALAFLLLVRGYGLYPLTVVLVLAHVVALGSKWWLLLRYVARPRLVVDVRSCTALARSTATFLGINGLNAVMNSLGVVLISKYVGEVGVGLYAAARQLTVPIELVSQSVVTSVYPTMVRSFEPTYERLRQITERLLQSLTAVVLPAVIGLYFLAEEALAFVYGSSDFSGAAVVLRILVWTMILRVSSKVFGLVLVASLRERVTLRILAIDLVAALIFGLVLISRFGIVGAAVSTLMVRSVDFIQRYVRVRRPFQSRIAFGRMVWQPIVASLCMVACLAMLSGRHLLLSITSAGVAYLSVLALLMIRSAGGLDHFRARYSHLWSK